ncbi:hypothetical protein [Mycobacteroides immunogenum]|nr:hypothetical protein [Mycobacteroides immunogenum]KPG44689.1 hypothetical protein AN916_25410 [Mycobacteroides immunogenum]MCV7307210.1 hypothetical protein [Mycobacteroides immunogenum]
MIINNLADIDGPTPASTFDMTVWGIAAFVCLALTVGLVVVAGHRDTEWQWRLGAALAAAFTLWLYWNALWQPLSGHNFWDVVKLPGTFLGITVLGFVVSSLVALDYRSSGKAVNAHFATVAFGLAFLVTGAEIVRLMG